MSCLCDFTSDSCVSGAELDDQRKWQACGAASIFCRVPYAVLSPVEHAGVSRADATLSHERQLGGASEYHANHTEVTHIGPICA